MLMLVFLLSFPSPFVLQMDSLLKENRFHRETERLEFERLNDDKSNETTIMRMYHQLNELRELEMLARKDAETSNKIVKLRNGELKNMQKMLDEK